MTQCRFIIFFLLIAALAPIRLIAQERVVTVAAVDDAEIRRTATRLKMCPKKLKELRILLDRATDLVFAIDEESWTRDSFSGVALGWLKLDRARAASVIQAFVNHLRTLATSTADPRIYKEVTKEARDVVSRLRPLLFESDATMDDWPGPPPLQSSQTSDWHRDLLQQELYSTHLDPLEALQRLQEIETQIGNYRFRPKLIDRLVATGANDEASDLFRKTLQSMMTEPRMQNMQVVSELLHQAARRFPDQINSVMQVWRDLLAGFPSVPGTGRETKIGEYSIHVNSTEEHVLITAQNLLNRRPKLALQVIDALPGLAAKIESVGGLDAYLNRHNTVSVSGNKYREYYLELQWLAESDHQTFSDYLHNYGDPKDHLDQLIRLSHNFYSDPKLNPARGREILDAAVRIAWEMEDPRRLATIIQQLCGRYHQYEGDFPKEFIDLFFEALDRLEHLRSDVSISRLAESSRTRLIQDFVGLWLMHDIASAESYLASLGDDRLELMALRRSLTY